MQVATLRVHSIVRDGVNGFTYEHRSTRALQAALQRGVDDAQSLLGLGSRGYLYSEDGQVCEPLSYVFRVFFC